MDFTLTSGSNQATIRITFCGKISMVKFGGSILRHKFRSTKYCGKQFSGKICALKVYNHASPRIQVYY